MGGNAYRLSKKNKDQKEREKKAKEKADKKSKEYRKGIKNGFDEMNKLH